MIYDISSYHYILFYNIYHDEEYLPPHPPLAIGILLRRSMYYTSLWKETPFIQTTKFRLTSKGPNYKKKDMIFSLCFGNFFPEVWPVGTKSWISSKCKAYQGLASAPVSTSTTPNHVRWSPFSSCFSSTLKNIHILCCVCIVPNLHIL